MALIRFALIDAPLAAVRPYMEARRPIAAAAPEIIKKTYHCLIG